MAREYDSYLHMETSSPDVHRRIIHTGPTVSNLEGPLDFPGSNTVSKLQNFTVSKS